jgi:hypothetical protein
MSHSNKKTNSNYNNADPDLLLQKSGRKDPEPQTEPEN